MTFEWRSGDPPGGRRHNWAEGEAGPAVEATEVSASSGSQEVAWPFRDGPAEARGVESLYPLDSLLAAVVVERRVRP